MTERTFLVRMDDIKHCDYHHSANYCMKADCECKGDLDNRPDFCPLVPVSDYGLNLYDKRIWVEK